MAQLPETHTDILGKKAFAHFATLMADGTPQVSPVWVDQDNGMIVINSAVGRVKDKNIVRNPNVALSITDPDNPYRMIAVRGRVVERTTDGADEHIDKMAQKYLGQASYPYRQPGEVRVMYKIEPERVNVWG